MRALLALIVALVTGLLLTAVAQAQVAPPPRLEPVRDCFVSPPEGFDGETECGFLTVPERRDGDPKHTIQLAYMRYHSAAAEPGDPVIYLAGGPGDSGIENIALAGPLLGALLHTRDLIAFDQRGTGYSVPTLSCADWEAPPDAVPVDPDAPTANLDEITGCRDYWARQGVDVTAYTTSASAADVADLIAALGYRRGLLLGASYGSKLAQIVMRHYPDRVTAAVLDGAVPVALNQEVEQLAKVDYALERVFALCAADQGCDAFYPNLKPRFYDTVTQLAQTPLTLTLTVDGDPQAEPLDGMTLVNGLFVHLFMGRTGVEQFPYRLAQVEQGDTTYLSQLFSELSGVDPLSGDGLYNTVHCGEEVLLTTPDVLQTADDRVPWLAAAQPASTDDLLTGVFAECAAWGAPAADPEYAAPLSSTIPVLILQGGLDFQTPMPWARQAQVELPNSRLVYLPTAGHVTSLDDACSAHLVAQFAADPAAALDAACVAELPALRFYVPGLLLPEPGRPVLVQDEAGERRIATVVPASWWPLDLGESIYVAPDAAQWLTLSILQDRRSLAAIAHDLAGVSVGALETWTAGALSWEVLAPPDEGTWTGVYALRREGEVVYAVALEGYFVDRAAAMRGVLEPALAGWRSRTRVWSHFQPVSVTEGEQTLRTVIPPSWLPDPDERRSYLSPEGRAAVKVDILGPGASIRSLARSLTGEVDPEVRRLVVGVRTWSLFVSVDFDGRGLLYAFTQDRQGVYGFRLTLDVSDAAALWQQGGDLLYPMLAAFTLEE